MVPTVAHLDLCAMDVVEVSPRHDPSGMTAPAVHRLVLGCRPPLHGENRVAVLSHNARFARKSRLTRKLNPCNVVEVPFAFCVVERWRAEPVHCGSFQCVIQSSRSHACVSVSCQGSVLCFC